MIFCHCLLIKGHRSQVSSSPRQLEPGLACYNNCVVKSFQIWYLKSILCSNSPTSLGNHCMEKKQLFLSEIIGDQWKGKYPEKGWRKKPETKRKEIPPRTLCSFLQSPQVADELLSLLTLWQLRKALLLTVRRTLEKWTLQQRNGWERSCL